MLEEKETTPLHQIAVILWTSYMMCLVCAVHFLKPVWLILKTDLRWEEMTKNYIKLAFQIEFCRKYSCHLAFWLLHSFLFQQILFNPDHTVCSSSWFMKISEHDSVAGLFGKWQDISCLTSGQFPCLWLSKSLQGSVCLDAFSYDVRLIILVISQTWRLQCTLRQVLLSRTCCCSKINYEDFKTQC